MEDQCSPLSWGCYNLEEGIEEFKHSLFYTTWELEATIVSAQEEIARKEDELVYIKCLLTKTIKERDEAQAKCQRLMSENAILQQQQQLDSAPLPGTTSTGIEDETRGGESNNGFSYSDSNENAIASPGMDQISPPPPLSLPFPFPLPLPLPQAQVTEKLASKNRLPEKGKFLQAVMEAGPLLQTLLLAGQLPQWQHPPPRLNSIEIPPVAIPSPVVPLLLHQDSCVSTNGCFSKKTGEVFCEASVSSPNIKYQKVVHQSPLTNA